METKDEDLMGEYKITLTRDQILTLRDGDYVEVDVVIEDIFREIDSIHAAAVKEEEEVLEAIDKLEKEGVCLYCGEGEGV